MEYVLFGVLIVAAILIIAVPSVRLRSRLKGEPPDPQAKGRAVEVGGTKADSAHR